MDEDKKSKLDYSRRYRAANRQKLSDYARNRYIKNIDRERARQRQRRQENPEAIKRIQKKYYQTHPEKVAACRRKYHQNFIEAINAIKTAAGCCDCGYNKNPVALEFDHVNGTKARNVSACGSIAAAMKEAEKCVIRCSNCHQIATHDRIKKKHTT